LADCEDNEGCALIHTGVVSIEATIRQYVQKYAKVAKIKIIADTFTKKLEELNVMEDLKNKLAKQEKDVKKIVR